MRLEPLGTRSSDLRHRIEKWLRSGGHQYAQRRSALGIRYLVENRPGRIARVLSNSFGFGVPIAAWSSGVRAEARPWSSWLRKSRESAFLGLGWMVGRAPYLCWRAALLYFTADGITDAGRPAAAERRRLGRVVKLALGVGLQATSEAGVDPTVLAAVFASSGGDGQNCMRSARHCLLMSE